jgi:hypothetical protein
MATPNRIPSRVTQTNSCRTKLVPQDHAARRSPRFSQDGFAYESRHTSIRNSAMNACVSAGKQQFLISVYNLHYFPSRSSKSQKGDLGLSQDPLSFYHSLLSGAPASPQHMPSSTHPLISSSNNNAMHNTMVTIERVCFCNNAVAPKDCAECDKIYGNVPCPNHTLVPCSNNPTCQKLFHIACIAHALRNISANHPIPSCPTFAWNVPQLSLSQTWHGMCANRT